MKVGLSLRSIVEYIKSYVLPQSRRDGPDCPTTYGTACADHSFAAVCNPPLPPPPSQLHKISAKCENLSAKSLIRAHKGGNGEG